MSTYSQRKAINKEAEEKPKLDARKQRGIDLIPGDDPGYEEIMNARRNLERLSDALQGHHTSQPERFKLAATLCK